MPTDPSPESVDRRPVLKALAGTATALTAVGVGARVMLHRDDRPDTDRPAAGAVQDPDDGGPGLMLAAEAGSDVDSLYVGLGDELLPRVASRRWASARLPTSTHSMVAFTWTEPAKKPHLQIRSRTGGRWGAWTRMPLLQDVPDPGTDEASDVTGTDLVWIGAADGIQVQLTGGRPADLRLLLLRPAPQPRDRTAVRPAVSSRRRVGAVVVRPDILDRVVWGADESWRGKPQLIATIEQVHVHHTVTRNDYLPEDVPALIRGMYRYHTKTLGWSDIGYNFLVDRFGRIWTGRAGGANKPIRGAHTLGFNHNSTGVSMIGNFDQVAPTTQALDAVAAVAAWKLDLYARDPAGTTTVTSEGSDRFGRGRAVALPVIDGHRDTNETSCPGGNLYAALPDIRARSRARLDAAIAAASAPVGVLAPTTVTGQTVVGGTLTAKPGTYEPATAAVTYTWQRDGVDIASGPSYVVTAADVGRQLGVRATLTAELRQAATEVLVAGGTVLAPSVVKVKVKPKRKRAVVIVKVTPPPGVSTPVSGQVEVLLGERRRTVTLSNGRGSTRFKNLQPGRYLVRAKYAGAGLLIRGKAKTAVTVA